MISKYIGWADKNVIKTSDSLIYLRSHNLKLLIKKRDVPPSKVKDAMVCMFTQK